MIASIFAPGKAAQAEACLKGTCRLRQRCPERTSDATLRAQRLFCRSAAFHAKENTFQVFLLRVRLADTAKQNVSFDQFIFLQALSFKSA